MLIARIFTPVARLLLLVGIVVALSSVAVAQSRGPGRGPGGPFGGGGGSPLELLQRNEVQAELELLDDQKEEASQLAQTFNERRREMFMGFAERFRDRSASEEERRELQGQVREAMQKLNAETEKELGFLLPHQRKRLSQLQVQFRMRGGGGLGALASPEVGQNLALTDEQHEQLRNKARDLGQEFSKKLAELRRQMQEQLLAELSPEQQAKFKELVGDPFEFQDRHRTNVVHAGPEKTVDDHRKSELSP